MKVLTRIIKNRFEKGKKILDFGCGGGDLVQELLDLGYDVYGTDIHFKNGENRDRLIEQKKLVVIENIESRSNIDSAAYRIPFNEDEFDIVIADQTIEHVENLEQFIHESKRVLKKGGIFFGYFPSRFKLIEPHVGVPMGGIINNKLYYKICYKLGLCYKKVKSAEDLIKYMNNDVYYRSDNEIKDHFKKYFSNVEFKPELILKNIDRKSAKIIQKIPLGTSIFGKLWSKFIICKD